MGHKILLADDSITIQKVIELTFSDEDFELHTVGNGQKAIDEIRSIQPDIVLCDIIMPEKNGYEVCEFIKSTDELKHIPVLLLTGAFEPFDQERAKAAGCEGFLAKPFEPQTLISKVKELLASAQGAPAAAGPIPTAVPPPAAMPPEPPAAPAPPPITPAAELTQQDAAFGGESDETVMVPPPSMGGQPPVMGGPQVPATPSPPPLDASPGLDEGFAVEAGERELAMDPGDHTMLLGANEAPDIPGQSGGTPSGASDDIWNDVTSQAEPPRPPQPASPEPPDDGATVFMAEPPPMAPPPAPEPSLGRGVDNEMSVGHEDPDATWQMPGASDTQASPGPPDLGGFDDFNAPPPAMGELPPAMEMMPPPMQEEPQSLEPEPVAPDFGAEPSAPELGATNEVPPLEVTPEPIPSVDTHATMDPVMAGSDAFSPITPTPEPQSPEPPQMIDSPPEPPRETTHAMPTEPETPFTPVDTPSLSTPAPVVEPPAASAAKPASGGGADDDLVERVAQRVVDKLSSKVIQEIAWEVVPELAEGMIQREIDVLKSKIPKTG